MPTFDFQCTNDKCLAIKKDVSFQSMQQENHVCECDVCHSPMEKFWGTLEKSSVPGVIYKGSGFHCTDYPTGKF